MPFFKPSEFACKCCGVSEMNSQFMVKLELLRSAFDEPMIISSGYRCPKHNQAVSTTGATGPHTTGQACDVKVSGAAAYRLVRLAIAHGFTGIGVSQKGAHSSRFIHLDTLTQPHPRPSLWSY